MKEAMEIAQGYYISNGLNFQKEKAIPCAVEKDFSSSFESIDSSGDFEDASLSWLKAEFQYLMETLLYLPDNVFSSVDFSFLFYVCVCCVCLWSSWIHPIFSPTVNL
jgi:hypothetical protein